eukprot:gene2124-1300_t
MEEDRRYLIFLSFIFLFLLCCCSRTLHRTEILYNTTSDLMNFIPSRDTSIQERVSFFDDRTALDKISSLLFWYSFFFPIARTTSCAALYGFDRSILQNSAESIPQSLFCAIVLFFCRHLRIQRAFISPLVLTSFSVAPLMFEDDTVEPFSAAKRPRPSSFSWEGGALIQSLPFATPFRGRTDVEREFTRHTIRKKRARGEATTADADAPDSEGSAAEILMNQFRGRELCGKVVQLPTGYGIGLARLSGSLSATSQPSPPRRLVMASGAPASSYIVWGHDKPPEGAAVLCRWIALAAAIHRSEEGLTSHAYDLNIVPSTGHLSREVRQVLSYVICGSSRSCTLVESAVN